MGKMKRVRQKLHQAAARSRTHKKEEDINSSSDIEMRKTMDVLPGETDPTAGGISLFQSVNISSAHLMKQKLPDFDACSTITSKMFRGQNLKKKDKQKIRQETWKSKIDSLQRAKRTAKETKRKQQTPIVGDLTPMEEALPTLELLMREATGSSTNRQTTEKARPIAKERTRRIEMMSDVALFHKVLEHPMFQGNASQVMKEHLKIKLQTEGDRNKL